MATLKLKNIFTKAETLKAIQPPTLHRLLDRHGDYFRAGGVELGRPSGEDLDYDAIVRALMETDESAPRDLVDDLFFIDEMATKEGMDALLTDIETLPPAKRNLFGLDDNSTVADVAVLVRLNAPDLIERRHAARMLTFKRSFLYFQARNGAPPAFTEPSEQTLLALESALDDQFQQMKRGRHSKVFCYPKNDGIWFLVRHGEPCKREGAIEAGEPSSVYYRPEKHDVLCYDERRGELRINAETKKIRELYRAQFGLHLCGDEQQFPGTEKFTLEPLRTSGGDALTCTDVPALEWVHLTEIQYDRGMPDGETEIHRAKDLSRAFDRQGWPIPDEVHILRASFKVKFAESKTPRTVTICSTNAARYGRDSDAAVVEEWLIRRGFIVGTAGKDARGLATLAHA
ncbi:MAG: hypothetical protein KGR26_07695 [Cyanobacteria bacterium REEB65]|nr:hypothetical protein [Cyanobacteria bacterium REEB65]